MSLVARIWPGTLVGRKYCLELHWLQAHGAAKIGISSASVSDWERGITSIAPNDKEGKE
jgi:transcriptional regulator with XRE-family HTH domain